MPTGYTEIIEDQDISLKDFALRCARAFGVAASLRGSPLDDGMPEKIELDSFYPDSLAANRLALEELERMTLEEAKVLAVKEYDQREQDYLEDLERRNILKVRCSKLLEKSKQWKPPTKEHIELKKYVVDQLERTLRCDCEIRERKHKKLTARQYLAKEKAEVKKDIKHLEKRYKEAQKRNEKNNKWLSELRASLEKINEKV